MTSKRKNGLFTIPAGEDFTQSLAEGLIDQFFDQENPLAFSRIEIFLPTRRAVKSLSEVLTVKMTGEATILPRIRPVGDVEEDEIDAHASPDFGLPGWEELPPAMPGLRRDLLLAELVSRWSVNEEDYPDLTPARALPFAKELGRLIDSIETEEVDLGRIHDIIPENFAAHWGKTLKFLEIVFDHWPEILEGHGTINGAARRSKLLHLQGAVWESAPPDHPVIVAGSTGSIPATAAMMKTVLGLPQGMVILPGLDHALDERAWERIGETHPQFGLKNLLDGLDAGRDDVRLWQGVNQDRVNAVRQRLVQEAMRPAEATEGWLDCLKDISTDDILSAMSGLDLVDAPEPRSEAAIVAQIMREVLETPGKTAALVTPDRDLSRRVTVELERWGVKVNDSAGRPLRKTVPGSFLSLILDLWADDFAPTSLAAFIKHPLSGFGFSRPDARHHGAELEIACLRGPRPAPGAAGLRLAVAEAAGEHARYRPAQETLEALDKIIDLLDEGFSRITDALSGGVIDARALIEAHVSCAELIAATDDRSGAARLWSGEAGEASSLFISELLEEADSLNLKDFDDYRTLFENLLEGRNVRSGFGVHPRLFIWGPLEARLQSADVVILGGLNEGVWPQTVTVDPWLSRPMRKALGLSLPERRIGLAAHDFVQLACAPKVYLTRSLKQGGAPSIASRWVMRLFNLLRGHKLEHTLACDPAVLNRVEAVDRPDKFELSSEPLPKPPLAARPRNFSVTEVETWVRDPYAIYAKKVLGLRKLDPLDASVDAADRGTIIHRALEHFVARYPKGLPENAYDKLLEIGEDVFDHVASRPELRVFWWPRFEEIAAWFVEWETKQRESAKPFLWESRGEVEIAAPGGSFKLVAKIDRMDRNADGTVSVFDYKTGGNVPSNPQIETGFAPQLPLEAMIFSEDGFDTSVKGGVSELAYIHLGGKTPGTLRRVKDVKAVITRNVEGLKKLIDLYDNEEMPYRSRLRPMYMKYAGDYDHLARVKEWSVYGDGEEGA